MFLESFLALVSIRLVNSQHCTNVLWFIGEEVGLTMGHQHHQATEPAAIGT